MIGMEKSFRLLLDLPSSSHPFLKNDLIFGMYSEAERFLLRMYPTPFYEVEHGETGKKCQTFLVSSVRHRAPLSK